MIDVQEKHAERPPVFDGGSEADREALLAIHHEFARANDERDIDALRKIWSDNPNNIFFNTNGQTYYGLEDWLTLWAYLKPRLKTVKPYSPGNVSITIRGGMGLVIGDRVLRHYEWIDEQVDSRITRVSFLRWTQVCLREDGVWKVIHAHFSAGSTAPRPERA